MVDARRLERTAIGAVLVNFINRYMLGARTPSWARTASRNALPHGHRYASVYPKLSHDRQACASQHLQLLSFSASALHPIPHRQAWPATLSSTKRVVDLDEMQASLQSKGVKYLAPSFVDMHGIPKAKMVPLDHLYSCSRGSELFTGAAVDGVPQAVSDDEVCAVADPATMAVQLPYQRDVCYMPVRGKKLAPTPALAG